MSYRKQDTELTSFAAGLPSRVTLPASPSPPSCRRKSAPSSLRMWNGHVLKSNPSGFLAGSFGVAAATGALFFLGEVPRVRRDILQQFPFLDRYFDRTIPPEDNVSRAHLEYGNLLWGWRLICDSPSKSSAGCTFHTG